MTSATRFAAPAGDAVVKTVARMTSVSLMNAIMCPPRAELSHTISGSTNRQLKADRVCLVPGYVSRTRRLRTGERNCTRDEGGHLGDEGKMLRRTGCPNVEDRIGSTTDENCGGRRSAPRPVYTQKW